MSNRSYVAQTGDLGGKQLFCDWMPLSITTKQNVMSEDIHGQKIPVLRIGGQFQRAGIPNANGRIYPKNVLKEAVEAIQDDIKNRRVLGQYDHPIDAKIHMDRISHLITKVWMEGDVVWGECEVLDKVQHGRELKGLIESNINIGISSRGVGDMETTIYEGEEYYSVLPGFSIVTWDVVVQPSVKGSYLAIAESKEAAFRKSIRDVKAEKEAAVLAEIKKFLKR